MKVLMVITSHDQLGNTGRKTGFWLEELAAPYYVFKDAGVEITLASPKGGRPPLDPKSNEPKSRTDLTVRFEKDAAAEAQLDKSVRLDSVKQEDFDTVFYPGGHGPMWDLAEDENSIKLIKSFIAAGKPIGIVCHSTGALHHVKTTDGKFLVQGKEVTGFTNGEEEEMGLTKVVPFLVEDEMLRLGAVFSKVADGGSRGQRRLADHGTESSFLRSCREDADGSGTAKDHTSCHRSGVVDRISIERPLIVHGRGRGLPLERRFRWAPSPTAPNLRSKRPNIGLGSRSEPEDLKAYPPGSVVVLPGDTWHFLCKVGRVRHAGNRRRSARPRIQSGSR
jgi:putative intracellular protease/amidase